MPARNVRENAVVAALSGSNWVRNFREAGQAVPAYEGAYRLGFVAPGAEDNKGRGTTLMDAVRVTPVGGEVCRYNFLLVKGHTIGADAKLPDGADMVTGTRATIAAVIDAARRGLSLPVVHFASPNDGDGISEDGYALIYDAAPLIRLADNLDNRPHAPGHKWGRGNAPAVRVGMTPGIKSGGRYVAHEIGWRDDWTYAVAEDKVSYPQVQIGYHNSGLKHRWTRANIRDIPAMVDAAFDWSADSMSIYY